MEEDIKVLTVEELCRVLTKDEKIDTASIEQLRGILLEGSFSYYDNSVTIFTVNEIDGDSLLLLVNDLKEFSQIVTKAVARLRIKKFVSEAQDHLETNPECTSMQKLMVC